MNEQLYKIVLPTPFAVGDVNVFVIKGQTVTLIDAGIKTEAAWSVFKEKLNEIGLKPDDIKQVVLTHHHPDHVGMLDFFDKDIAIVGHAKNQPWISQNPDFFEWYDAFFEDHFMKAGVDERFRPYLKRLKASMKYSCHRSLTTSVQEGDYIPDLESWKVLEVPGHAQSHIALYNERTAVMIGGDLLLKHISSNPLIEPPMKPSGERPKTLLQYNHSLRRLLDLEINCIYTGHGDEVLHVRELVQERLQKQSDRADKVLSMIKERPQTAFDICKQLFPTIYEKELGLTLSETIGQLDFLEDANKISTHEKESTLIYSVCS